MFPEKSRKILEKSYSVYIFGFFVVYRYFIALLHYFFTVVYISRPTAWQALHNSLITHVQLCMHHADTTPLYKHYLWMQITCMSLCPSNWQLGQFPLPCGLLGHDCHKGLVWQHPQLLLGGSGASGVGSLLLASLEGGLAASRPTAGHHISVKANYACSMHQMKSDYQH